MSLHLFWLGATLSVYAHTAEGRVRSDAAFVGGTGRLSGCDWRVVWTPTTPHLTTIR